MTNKSNKGGARTGAGRKPGAPNKKTKELQDSVAASGVTPLAYMLEIMRDKTKEPETRLDAAKSAAPYVHAKLASIEVNANITQHEASLDELS